MNKSETKKKYKSLVRQGKLVEAEKVLNSLRNWSSQLIEEEPKKEKKKVKEKSKKKEEFSELSKIKGIGKKTIKDIKRICNSIEDLKIMVKQDKLPLRDDVVIKLRNHLEG